MRIRVTDKNNIPAIIKTLNELDGQKIEVGVLGEGKQQMIAGVQEYGIRILVTFKMRRYLASQGLFLKRDTHYITIPERSFIRAGWDQHERDVLDKSDAMIPELIDKGISVNAYLNALGDEATSYIKDFARDLKDPENHPFTIKQKQSSNPLVDTGGMIGAITYEII